MEPVIDIRVPSIVEKGFVSILVYVDGEPAEGNIELGSPGGNRYARALRNGKTNFYFDESGDWIVSFGKASKKVVVKEDAEAAAPVEEPLVKEEPGKQTGLFLAGVAPTQIGLALLLLAALAYLFYEYWWKRVAITKKYDGKRVVITVENRKEDLHDVELLDLAPEGGEVKVPENAEASETITGTAIKWRKKKLHKGEKWMVSYGLRGGEKNFKPVELKALNANEIEVNAFS